MQRDYGSLSGEGHQKGEDRGAVASSYSVVPSGFVELPGYTHQLVAVLLRADVASEAAPTLGDDLFYSMIELQDVPEACQLGHTI